MFARILHRDHQSCTCSGVVHSLSKRDNSLIPPRGGPSQSPWEGQGAWKNNNHLTSREHSMQPQLISASRIHHLLALTLILLLTLTTACTTGGTQTSQPTPTQAANSPPIVGCPLFLPTMSG